MSSKTTIYRLNHPDKNDIYRESNKVKCRNRYETNEEYRQHKIEYAKNRYRMLKEMRANTAVSC
jgi:hypothetical protein